MVPGNRELMLARDEFPLKRSAPLYALHIAVAARWCRSPAMKCRCNTPSGVLREHLHTRSSAGLFDVSHIGQIALLPKSGRVQDAALALERLVPQDIAGVAPGRQRYAQFTNGDGSILMI